MFRPAGFVLHTRRSAQHLTGRTQTLRSRPVRRADTYTSLTLRACAAQRGHGMQLRCGRVHGAWLQNNSNREHVWLALNIPAALPAILPIVELPPCAPEQRHPEGSHEGDPPPQRRAPRNRPHAPLLDQPVAESPLPPTRPQVSDGHIDIRAAG
jgi:hypothetical protein